MGLLDLRIPTQMDIMDKDIGDGVLTRQFFEFLLEDVSIGMLVELVDHRVNV